MMATAIWMRTAFSVVPQNFYTLADTLCETLPNKSRSVLKNKAAFVRP